MLRYRYIIVHTTYRFVMSRLAQTYSDIEVIVIDDAFDNATTQVVEKNRRFQSVILSA